MINVTGWRPIKEYFEGKYDWVLVRMMDGPNVCVPEVAEFRNGKWCTDDSELPFPVVEFFDMEQLDQVLNLSRI